MTNTVTTTPHMGLVLETVPLTRKLRARALDIAQESLATVAHDLIDCAMHEAMSEATKGNPDGLAPTDSANDWAKNTQRQLETHLRAAAATIIAQLKKEQGL